MTLMLLHSQARWLRLEGHEETRFVSSFGTTSTMQNTSDILRKQP